MDLDLNPADFQLCDGFGLDFTNFNRIWIGFHNFVLNFLVTSSSVSHL